MTVQKINFTSENSFLNKIKTPAQPPVAQTAPDIKSETETSTEVPAKNHNKRNWTIGLSAAAVLTALGVVGGRSGYLGKGVQKVLGGAKNKAGEVADDLGRRGEELVEDIVGEAKPQAPEVKPAGITVKPDATEVIEPEVFGPETQTRVEPSLPESKPTVSKPEPAEVKPVETTAKPETVEATGKPEEVKPSVSHKVDVDGINARLDRTLPNMDDVPVSIELPDGLNDLRALSMNLESLFAPDKGGVVFKDGSLLHKVDAARNSISVISKDNTITTVKYGDDAKAFTIEVKKGNNEFRYNSQGKLVSINEFTDGGNLSRCINVTPGTKNVVSMAHCEGVFFVKRDIYKDGKVIEEQFFDPAGQNVIEIIKR